MPLLDDQGKLFGRISLVDLGALLILLLLATPIITFNYRIYVLTPTISRVEPMEMIITADQNAPLTIHGSRFSSKSVALIGGVSLTPASARPRRLDLLLPTQKIYPGSYTLTLTNPRGLAVVWKEPVRLISIPPRIDDAQPRSFTERDKIRIVIHGSNFQASSSVQVGNWTLNMRYISPTRLEAWGVPPLLLNGGRHTLRVTNYYGQYDQLENAISLPPPSEENPPATVTAAPETLIPILKKTLIPILKSPIPVQIICAFREPETHGRRKMLRHGAITYYMEDPARPIAKIIRILDKTSIPKSDRSLILATLVLACDRDPSSQTMFRYGRGLRGYPPEGDAVEINKRLTFKFQRLDIQGTVLTHPVPLEGTWEEYVDQ